MLGEVQPGMITGKKFTLLIQQSITEVEVDSTSGKLSVSCE